MRRHIFAVRLGEMRLRVYLPDQGYMHLVSNLSGRRRRLLDYVGHGQGGGTPQNSGVDSSRKPGSVRLLTFEVMEAYCDCTRRFARQENSATHITWNTRRNCRSSGPQAWLQPAKLIFPAADGRFYPPLSKSRHSPAVVSSTADVPTATDQGNVAHTPR